MRIAEQRDPTAQRNGLNALGVGDDHIYKSTHDLTTATAPSGISAGCPVGLLIAVFITAAGFLVLTRSRG